MAFTDTIAAKIQKIPARTRMIGFFVFIGVVVILYIWQVHIPKNTEIKKLETDIVGLQAKIRENDEKIKKLDALRVEVAALQQRLKVLTEQLPPETEVSGLLRQVQNLVTQSGLSLRVWKPERRTQHASGLYIEIPISLELGGGYHNLAMFFDKVSKLTRIVNIMNLRMSGATMRPKDRTIVINVNCTAMTFAAVEKK